jgi:hypothetical protein
LALLSIAVNVDTNSAANARRYVRGLIDAHVRPAADRRRRPGRRLSLHRLMRPTDLPLVSASDQGFLLILVEHHVMLLDWTGWELRADRRGVIPDHRVRIMERLGLNPSNWAETVRGFGRRFKQAAGRSGSLVNAAAIVPGQGHGSNCPCIGHHLDAVPSTDVSIALPLEESDRLKRSTRCPPSSRQGEPFNRVELSDHAHTTVVSRRSVSDSL